MPRCNIIILQGEDVGRHLACYGDDYARTPHLDRLATSGRRYDAAFSTAPVCSPSRSSMITGAYPWSIGTHHHRSELLAPPQLFTETLRQAGWYVNWGNKTDFNFEPPAAFADDRRPWLDDLRSGTLPADRPFLLYHNFTCTHESTMWRCAQQWGANGERLTADHLLGEDRHDMTAAPVPPYLADEPEVRGDIARYYDALTIQDRQIGEVLDALAASPHADSTYVIYLSDHGRGLLREKRWCYAPGLHMPFLISGPDIPAGEAVDDVVSWVDLAPTILGLAGLAPDAHHQGIDILKDRRSVAFAGRGRMDETYDAQRTATDGRYLFVHNLAPELPFAQPNIYEHIQLTTQVTREAYAAGRLTGPARDFFAETKPVEEFFDLQADPHCVVNLIDDPVMAEQVDRLRQALMEHRAEVADLGDIPEAELIARGLVADSLTAMNRRRVHGLQGLFAVAEREHAALEMTGHETFDLPGKS